MPKEKWFPFVVGLSSILLQVFESTHSDLSAINDTSLDYIYTCSCLRVQKVEIQRNKGYRGIDSSVER